MAFLREVINLKKTYFKTHLGKLSVEKFELIPESERRGEKEIKRGERNII